MVDAGECAGQDWAAAVEGMFVERLPMVNDAHRIFADERSEPDVTPRR